MFRVSRFSHFRSFCTAKMLKTDVIDWEYYSNPDNISHIVNNVTSRNISCDLLNVVNQLKELHRSRNDAQKYESLKIALLPQIMWFPNNIHPRVLASKSEEAVTVKKVGKKCSFTYFPTNFESLTKRLNILRTKNLGHMTGNKSYYLKGDLALLEQALVRFTLKKLLMKNFQLVSVPDIVSRRSLEGCGMKTDSVHSQIYHLDDSWAENMCLSGTSEIAFGSYLSSKIFDKDSLPMRLCAVSRCYRAEAKRHQKEKGIFRVHQFTKVEMFGVTVNETGEESEELLKEFTEIQEEIFSELGLYFKVLEMPACDLGLPAYHKYDMEAWIPTQKIFGEISSASNCTDFQSRRLNIRYMSPSSNEKFCHTVNGTACAIPRLLITIFENFQNLDGSINIPVPLQTYMGKKIISDKFKEHLVCIKPTK